MDTVQSASYHNNSHHKSDQYRVAAAGAAATITITTTATANTYGRCISSNNKVNHTAIS